MCSAFMVESADSHTLPGSDSLEGVLRMLAPEMIAELVIANMDFLERPETNFLPPQVETCTSRPAPNLHPQREVRVAAAASAPAGAECGDSRPAACKASQAHT